MPVTLTDKFPNQDAFEYAQRRSHGRVSFIRSSIDATAVPSHLSGFRTLFNGYIIFAPTRPGISYRML